MLSQSVQCRTVGKGEATVAMSSNPGWEGGLSLISFHYSYVYNILTGIATQNLKFK